MVIENRDLALGTRLVARYKGVEHFCTVTTGFDGTFPVYDYQGTGYKSLSAAGSVAMGGKPCNGWRFFSLAEGDAPASAPTPAVEAAAKPTKGEAKVREYHHIKRVPNQKGVSEGHTRFFCDGCMASFEAEGTERPTTCPQGHDEEFRQAAQVAA